MTWAALAIWFALNGSVGLGWAHIEHRAGEAWWARTVGRTSLAILALSALLYLVAGRLA